jgi:hypothetical protein
VNIRAYFDGAQIRYVLSISKSEREIDSLLHAEAEWAGKSVPAPTANAAEAAKRFLRTSPVLRPSRIIASGEGGIAFCYLRTGAYADVEFLNSGEILASIEDRAKGQSEIWDVVPGDWDATRERLTSFLAKYASKDPVR